MEHPNQQDTSMNMDSLLENATPILPKTDSEPAPVQDELGEQLTQPEETPVVYPTTYPNEEETTGYVVSAEEIEKAKQQEEAAKIAPSQLPDLMSNVNSYLEEREEEFDELNEKLSELDPRMKAEKAKQERLAQEQANTSEEVSEEDDEEDDEERRRKFKSDYDTAVVIINKLNASDTQFTAEERAKMERVKKIRVEEVSLVSLETLRTRKPKKNTSVDKVIKRKSSTLTTPIVLSASGYTASMTGASTYELVTLLNSTENPMIDAQSRWSIIHSKLAEASIPGITEDFNKFLRATAFTDYNMFLYGILVSTYPDSDKVPLTCDEESCGKPFDHEYSPRELLRAEKIMKAPQLQQLVKDIVDNSLIEESAVQVHNNAPVNTVKAIRLPHSEIILEIYVQSAHDFIHKTISSLAGNEEERYGQAAMLATIVNRALVLDPDSEEEEYIEYTDPMDITKIIYSFTDIDILTLSNQGDVLSDIAFDFGLMNVACPHCGKHHETIPVELEQMLFYQYQQAMNTTVE